MRQMAPINNNSNSFFSMTVLAVETVSSQEIELYVRYSTLFDYMFPFHPINS